MNAFHRNKYYYKYKWKLLKRQSFAGIVFSDYHEQLKLQRNVSMVALRGLGYGKKSVENKIVEEAEYLSRAFKVSIHHRYWTKLIN